MGGAFSYERGTPVDGLVNTDEDGESALSGDTGRSSLSILKCRAANLKSRIAW
jgi:hypothetical protein